VVLGLKADQERTRSITSQSDPGPEYRLRRGRDGERNLLALPFPGHREGHPADFAFLDVLEIELVKLPAPEPEAAGEAQDGEIALGPRRGLSRRGARKASTWKA
jgi:hypothetical protein